MSRINIKNAYPIMSHTLKNMALAATAVNYWSSPEIKVDIENYFLKKSNLYCQEPCNVGWSDIEIKIMDFVTYLHLPGKLPDQLKDVVRIIGRKIFFWTKYVVLDLNLDIKYAEEIYWTSGGSIDEVKIVQDVWLPDPNFNTCKRKRVNPISLPSFKIGCLFVPREFIMNNNLTAMGKVIQPFYAKTNKSEKYKTIELDIQSDLKKYNIKYLSKTIKLFFLSLYSGLDKVIKYLAEAIGTNLQHFLNLAIRICIEELKCKENDYVKEKFVTIFLFLSNRLPIKENNHFFPMINNISELFLEVWSYHEQYLKFLNVALNEFPTKLCNHVLKDFINRNYLIKTHNPLSSVQKEITSKILGLIMSKVPRGMKIAFFIRKLVMVEIFKALNFPVLNVIINDRDLIDQREYLIGIGMDVFGEYVKEGKFEIFEGFVEEVLHPDDEKMILRYKKKILLDLISSENFIFAEKYLDGFCIPDDKKLRMKGRIEMISICSSFTQENSNSELIKKLLEFNEEKTKNLMKMYDTVLNGVCQIWCTKFRTSAEEAVKTSSEFLKYFIKASKIDHFKKEKLVRNENFIKLFLCHLSTPKDFEIIDEFFKFCDVPIEKINEIKLKIIDNLEEWIDFYALQQDKFLWIHHIVSWIFEDVFVKKLAIERFFVSDAGALLCTKIISEEKSSEGADEMLTLIDSWIKPCQQDVIDLLLVKISETDCEEILKNYIINNITSLDSQIPENMTEGDIEESNPNFMEIDDPDIDLQKSILADIQQRKFEDEILLTQAICNSEPNDDLDFLFSNNF